MLSSKRSAYPRSKILIFLTTGFILSLLLSITWLREEPSKALAFASDYLPWIQSSRPSGRPSMASLSEISKGSWTLDARHRNDTRDWNWAAPCHGLNATRDADNNVIGDDGTRAENVDGWSFVLEDGSPLHEWSVERITIRALQSRVGFMIIGGTYGGNCCILCRGG